MSSSRRDFLKAGLVGLSAMTALSALSGCSTLDEYVFEDQFDLKDQVLIVGGGVSGLYLAYKLRQIRSEYRLLEGSSYLGGRVRSYQGLDFGASLFQHSDERVSALVKEFSLVKLPHGKDSYFIQGGAETLTQALQDRISGLMPYRSLRVRWQLVALHKNKDKYEAVFDMPKGRRVITCRRMALTLPPAQWANVDGLLQLPEMEWATEWLKTLHPETSTRLVATVPASSFAGTGLNPKKSAAIVLEKDVLTMTTKSLKNNLYGLEFDYLTRQSLTEKFKIQTTQTIEIEKYLDQVNAKTRLGLSVRRVNTDSFFDWAAVDLIQSSRFKNATPIPNDVRKNPVFQVFGDYSAIQKPHTVEGALTEAERVSSFFV